MAPLLFDESTAMSLYMLLALPLALSSSNSFAHSHSLASHCLQPSLSFNLSSTPLLFVPPLSTSQPSSILHSLHCRQICVVVNRLIPPQTNMNRPIQRPSLIRARKLSQQMLMTT
jgi:hypothetical protein